MLKSLNATPNDANGGNNNNALATTTSTNEPSRSSSNEVEELISLSRVGKANRLQLTNASAAAAMDSCLQGECAHVKRKHQRTTQRRGTTAASRSRSRRRKVSRAKSSQRRY